jgi:WD40 repeat protein
MIVFASPAAVASAWCVREQQWWLDHHGTERLLIVFADGEIAWDRDANDFDWSRTTAVAPIFARRFADEPLWIDLRWARGVDGLNLRHPRFRDAVVDAAAPIRGQRKDAVDSADLRQHTRNRALVRGGVAAIALAGAVAAWQAVVASRERDAAVAARTEAERQRDAATARTLALQSAAVREREPASLEVAALLAVESLRIDAGPLAQSALRAAAALLPEMRLRVAGDLRTPLGRVRALAFSPDAGRLASAHDDGSVRLADLARGQDVATLRHGDAVSAIAFSPDGTQLASASRDGRAHIWSAAGGEPRWTLAHDAPVASVAWHPREELLASGSEDGTLRLWSAADGREQARFALGAEVREVAFSPDGQALAAIATNGCALVVDMARVTARWRRCGGASGLALVWSPDGRHIAVARADHAAVLDAASGEVRMQASHADAVRADSSEPLRWITGVAWRAEASQLVTAGRDGSVRLWRVDSGAEALRIETGSGETGLAVDPRGTYVASASSDGTARLWDARSGREWLRAAHPAGAEVVAFSRDGQLVASGGSDGSVSAWTTTRSDAPLVLHTGEELTQVAASADGTRIAAASREGRLRLWSSEGRELGRRESVHGVVRLDFDAAGGTLIAAQRGDTVMLLDTRSPSLEPRATLKLRSGGDWVIDARVLVAAERDGQRLRAWRAANGQALADVEAPRAHRIGLAANAAEAWVWQAAADGRGSGRIVVRRLPGLESLAEVGFDREPLVALPGDGRSLITATRHAIQWWDLGPRRLLREAALDTPLDGLRLDPAGRVLIGWREGRVLGWDAATGVALAGWAADGLRGLRFVPGASTHLAMATARAVQIVDPRRAGDEARIDLADTWRSMAWLGDGTQLVVATHDGQVSRRVWRADELQRIACERVGRDLTRDEWARHVGTLPWRATCSRAANAR